MKNLFVVLIFAGTVFAQQPSELKPIFEVVGTDSGSRMGDYVKGIGDVNKDGYADVAVSAPRRLKTFLYLGGNPMSPQPALVFDGGGIIASGDLNGDGWVDLAIEKSFKDTVIVYFGAAQMDTIPDAILAGEHVGDSFGLESLAFGDINGDGYKDLIVGAPQYPNPDGPYRFRGKLYVYSGGTTLSSVPTATFLGDTLSSRLGYELVTGDVNGDGIDDILARGFHTTNPNASFWYYTLSIFLGRGSFQLNRDYYIDSRNVPGGFGAAASQNLASFDADGDEIDDVLVSKIHIFKGSAALDTLPTYTILPPNNDTVTYGRFPRVAGSGDFNGDGVKDVLLGSSGFAARVLLYLGGKGLTQGFRAFRQGSPFDGFSADFGSAGDVNGDGISDIIIGAPGYDSGFGHGFFGIYSGDSLIVVSVDSGIDELPQEFQLDQNYPNPFNPETTIEYTVARRELVRLTVYDSAGKKVKQLVDDIHSPGLYRVRWDGRGESGERVASGIYYYQLWTPASKSTRKSIHLK